VCEGVWEGGVPSRPWCSTPTWKSGYNICSQDDSGVPQATYLASGPGDKAQSSASHQNGGILMGREASKKQVAQAKARVKAES
jgi:hypothetical protein